MPNERRAQKVFSVPLLITGILIVVCVVAPFGLWIVHTLAPLPPMCTVAPELFLGKDSTGVYKGEIVFVPCDTETCVPIVITSYQEDSHFVFPIIELGSICVSVRP